MVDLRNYVTIISIFARSKTGGTKQIINKNIIE
jgi:hypothetical protein